MFPTSEPDKSYQKNDTPSGMFETRAHGAAVGNSVFWASLIFRKKCLIYTEQ